LRGGKEEGGGGGGGKKGKGGERATAKEEKRFFRKALAHPSYGKKEKGGKKKEEERGEGKEATGEKLTPGLGFCAFYFPTNSCIWGGEEKRKGRKGKKRGEAEKVIHPPL